MRAAHHGFKNGRRSSQKVFTPFPYLRIREVLAMTVRNYLWGHRYHGTCIYGGARGCRCGVISSAITIGNCYRIQRLKSMIGYKVMLCSNTLEVSMMGDKLLYLLENEAKSWTAPNAPPPNPNIRGASGPPPAPPLPTPMSVFMLFRRRC